MKVFVDTNVVIDVLARREPFYGASRQVLEWCQKGLGCGMLSTLTYANVAYVMRKYVGFDQMLLCIRRLHRLFETVPMTDSSVRYAIDSGHTDFEDAMQYESALSAKADVIVTRNPRDFIGSSIRVMTPVEFEKEVA